MNYRTHMLTVRELIDLLQNQPLDASVVIVGGDETWPGCRVLTGVDYDDYREQVVLTGEG